VAENLLKQFREPFKIEDTDIFLGASIGIAVYPIDGATTEELVRNADLAMYKSKESGKNTYSHYTTGLNAEARQKLRLESDLRRALAEEELEVFFQPTVSLDSGEIFGAEALVRWRGEDGEYRNTAEFIHFAESTGIIVEIDLFVMETACRAAAQWIEKLSDPLRISVNVSTRHFKRGDLREKVAAILEKTGLPAERLNLEITETALMQNLQQASSALIELNALGVSFSLDDYGTGYSSLYYLNTLPVQSLKIDKRFVSRLTEQAGDGPVLVKTVMSLAENLGLAAVAEGVETRGQLEALRELGCRQGQGFLFSPAVPPERFERLLAKGRLTPARDNISHIDGKTAGLFKVK
jgi:predicted signal transduction protein with EAL and GGDEF domain